MWNWQRNSSSCSSNIFKSTNTTLKVHLHAFNFSSMFAMHYHSHASHLLLASAAGFYRDCEDAYECSVSGLYTIQPDDKFPSVQVYCDTWRLTVVCSSAGRMDQRTSIMTGWTTHEDLGTWQRNFGWDWGNTSNYGPFRIWEKWTASGPGRLWRKHCLCQV